VKVKSKMVMVIEAEDPQILQFAEEVNQDDCNFGCLFDSCCGQKEKRCKDAEVCCWVQVGYYQFEPDSKRWTGRVNNASET
jgi:hypothetical protein